MALRRVTPAQNETTEADPNLTRAFTVEELQAAAAQLAAQDAAQNAEAEAPIEGEVVSETVDEETGEIVEPIQDSLENRPLAPAVAQAPAGLPSTQTTSSIITQDHSDLSFDWTSFPTISLKTEGDFVDIDNHNYGKEIFCRIQGWKKRWVYRANPVSDNKRDVGFSYDEVNMQSGVSVAAKIAEWEAMGRVIEKREYLEVIVQMEAPEEPYDGEFRILSVSPTSKGRFSGYAQRAAQLGQGNTANVVTRVYVGEKITKVANPFYPWMFALHSIG